ncbi:unnamed protein product [Ilex paraguariensis]|uniref:SET domain-containing protein n=1 Tax=Ilex paraguariensis TaxID=185542 RepID=A0ABC8TK26_9AQUA
MEEEHANLENFLEWTAELGISDSPYSFTQSESLTRRSSSLGLSLCVSDFPEAGGRGLAAVRDLQKGELILRVPKSALMTTQRLMMEDQKLSVAVQKRPSLSSTQTLTAALLNEVGKGKISWWNPYIMQLPRSYDTLASFGQFEAQSLQVDDAIWLAEKALGKAELEWKEATPLMSELKLKPQLLTLKAWRWASATISSRTMHIPWDVAGCLCPVGDFFNYAAPGEEPYGSDGSRAQGIASSLQDSSWYTREISDDEKFDPNSLRLMDGKYEEHVGAYCFYARRNYRKGEQVLLSYGTYTNLELLEHYGFLLNENPNDKAFVALEPGMYSLCSWPKDSLYIHKDGMPSFALLLAVRLWATPPNHRKSIGHLVYSGTQVSAENEVIVMKWIAKECDVLLKSFPTSVEQDMLLLSTIDKLQDLHTPMNLEKELPAFRGEVCAFLSSNELQGGRIGAKLLVSKKARKSLYRWKLAVQWRLKYKKILLDCISQCSEIINNISSY